MLHERRLRFVAPRVSQLQLYEGLRILKPVRFFASGRTIPFPLTDSSQKVCAMNGLPMTRSSIRGALTVGFAATGILMTGCSSHLRAADQVLELPRMSGLVQSFPMSAADMAATLPVAATRAGWSVVKDGGPSEPWILELPWGFNEACLLYTSPSPRDRTRSRMPSSA